MDKNLIIKNLYLILFYVLLTIIYILYTNHFMLMSKIAEYAYYRGDTVGMYLFNFIAFFYR
jgi:predicted AAA+ superfamily ATPase